MKKEFLEIANKIIKSILKVENPYSLEEMEKRFAFDIKLPYPVIDAITKEETWASSPNGKNYITNKNMEKKDASGGWMLPKRDLKNLEELLQIWSSINLITTERVYDSMNVFKSDTIYNCENIYHCGDCRSCKNLLFCDSCGDSEFLIASQRSASCNFSIRVDDSKNCSNCYNVICSNKIQNSLFIQDSYNLEECMFCSHIASKKYCIANMQFEKEEYFEVKRKIIEWILNS